MSVHYCGKCIPCIDVKCLVPCETKRNKTQPFIVMQGFAESVELKSDSIVVIR